MLFRKSFSHWRNKDLFAKRPIHPIRHILILVIENSEKKRVVIVFRFKCFAKCESLENEPLIANRPIYSIRHILILVIENSKNKTVERAFVSLVARLTFPFLYCLIVASEPNHSSTGVFGEILCQKSNNIFSLSRSIFAQST